MGLRALGDRIAWSEQQELVGAGGSATPTQGNGVALSGDGATALIGAPTNEEDGGATEPGAAWAFARVGEQAAEKNRRKKPRNATLPEQVAHPQATPQQATGQLTHRGLET